MSAEYERGRAAEAAAQVHFAPPTHPTSGPCCMTPEAIRQFVCAVWPIAYEAGRNGEAWQNKQREGRA